MQLVKKVAAGAAFSLMASVGIAATTPAQAQAPLELDLTQLDQVIIELQDSIQALAFDLGEVMTDLGQQPGLNEALTAVGTLLTGDAILDLIIDLVSPFFN